MDNFEIIASVKAASGAVVVGQWNNAGLGQVLVDGKVWEHTQGRSALLEAVRRVAEED